MLVMNAREQTSSNWWNMVKDERGNDDGDIPTVGRGSRPRRAAAVAAQKRLAGSSSKSSSHCDSEQVVDESSDSEQSLHASAQDELELVKKEEEDKKEEMEEEEDIKEEEESDDQKAPSPTRRASKPRFSTNDGEDDDGETETTPPTKKRKRQGSAQSTKSKYQRVRGTLAKRTCPTCQRVFTSPHGLKYHISTCCKRNGDVRRRSLSHFVLLFGLRQESMYSHLLDIDRQVGLSHVGTRATVLHKIWYSLGRGR
jgi:hypothetical protein